MQRLFNILKKMLIPKQIEVSIMNINGYNEIVFNILNTENYTIRITINYVMELICLEILTNNDNATVLTNFDKFFKKHICLYSFYLRAKETFIKDNKKDILNFLQDFGASFSYTHFVSLLA